MRFFGNVFAWAFAAVVAYGLASVFSTQIVLHRLADMGATIDWATRWDTTLKDVMGLWQYGLVIAAGFAIAFFIASLVKAVLPFLARIAYPVAGAAAVALALFLMLKIYGVYPIGGAQTTLGYGLQLVAAAIGGLVFELTRPKGRE